MPDLGAMVNLASDHAAARKVAPDRPGGVRGDAAAQPAPPGFLLAWAAAAPGRGRPGYTTAKAAVVAFVHASAPGRSAAILVRPRMSQARQSFAQRRDSTNPSA